MNLSHAIGQITQRPPADLNELRRYTFTDPALEREILELFCATTPDHFNRLSDCCTGKCAHNARDWHLAVHTIKSSAVTIGAWDVSDLAVMLLNMPHDPITEEHKGLVADLGQALAAVYAYVPHLLEDLQPVS